jgi:2-oxoglutarate dehydrogenase E1 component
MKCAWAAPRPGQVEAVWATLCTGTLGGVADDSQPDLSTTAALGPNAWLVDEMYEQYLADPTSVSESWRDFFADYRRDVDHQGPAAPARSGNGMTTPVAGNVAGTMAPPAPAAPAPAPAVPAAQPAPAPATPAPAAAPAQAPAAKGQGGEARAGRAAR